MMWGGGRGKGGEASCQVPAIEPVGVPRMALSADAILQPQARMSDRTRLFEAKLGRFFLLTCLQTQIILTLLTLTLTLVNSSRLRWTASQTLSTRLRLRSKTATSCTSQSSTRTASGSEV